jgi:hypothetical protein
MARFCGHLLRFAAAFGVLLALLATEARAGNIEIILDVSGIPSPFVINLGGPFTQPGATMDNITANTSALNATLTADGSSLQFSSLGATSNNPGAANATLSQSGTAYSTGGAVSFTVQSFQVDYNSPVGAKGELQSSAGGTFTNTNAGDNTTFRSWYDGTNMGNTGAPTYTPIGTPSPLLTFTSPTLVGALPNTSSYSGNAAMTPLTPFVVPFALVNQISVSLAANTHTPTDQFTGSTVVTATSIPEPSSLALLGIGMTGFLAFRRFFKRPAVA